MVKARTTISIEADLIEKAQKAMINISGLTESAIKNKLGERTINISTEEKCQDCGRIEEKQRAGDLTKGMVWLWPDEIWLCNKCLRTRVRHVPVRQR